jgi:mRNA interferase MazF
MSRVPRRGDVFWVNLDPVIGTEIRKTRPAVVVSNDSCNRYGARVVVLPITSNIDSLYPGEAMIEVKGRQGRALGDQIRSIDKRRLKARVSTLTADEMARIDEALAITLGLPL